MPEPTQDAPAADPGQGPQQPGAAPQQPAPGEPDGSKPPAQEVVSRAELNRVIGQRDTAKTLTREVQARLENAESLLAKMPSDEDLNRLASLKDKEDKAAKDKAMKEGDADALVANARKPLQDQVENLQGKVERRETQLAELFRDKALLSAAATANAVRPDLVVKLLRDRVRMEERPDGTFAPKFTNEDGSPLFDEAGEVTDTQKFVSSFLDLPENAIFVKSSAKPGSGAAPAGGQVDPNRLPTTLEEFKALPPEQRAEVSQRMTSAQRRALAGVSKSADSGTLLTQR